MKVVRISDGLGNQMFQYAFARKLQIISREKVFLDVRFINHHDIFMKGEKKPDRYKNDFRKYGLNSFRISLPIADDDVLQKWKYMEQRNKMDKLLFCLEQNKMWPWRFESETEIKKRNDWNKINLILPSYYCGYFFDLTYYDDIKNILQKDFKVRVPFALPKELKKIIYNENTISLHVRKGDFVKNHRDISQTRYYSMACELMCKLVSNPVFLVFSDEIDWVKKNMDLPGEKIYVSQGNFEDYQELTIMKHCKHNIIANSTFSYWAAYLNDNPNKKVICPKHWKENAIPKDWITL